MTNCAGLSIRAISICAFRRVGTYHPEAYAYKYLNLVHFWLNLLKPFTVFVTWIARLAAVPFGVEINRTEKSVTMPLPGSVQAHALCMDKMHPQHMGPEKYQNKYHMPLRSAELH